MNSFTRQGKARQGKARQGSRQIALWAACLIASGTSTAIAQSTVPHHFSDSRIIVGDWTFVPIYSEDSAQIQVVDGLFAYADELSRTGNNLSAVWYDKRDDGWYASSWETVDLQEAIKSVVIEENIQNQLWEDLVGSPFEGVPESPKGFLNGVLVGDPVESAVNNSGDPEPLVDFLVTVGYAAADVPVIGDQGCNKEALLDDLAVQSLEFIVGGDQTVAYVNANLCEMAGIPVGPDPVPTPRPATAPPHVPVPTNGPLPGTGWITGAWPTTGTPPVADWYCHIRGNPNGGYTCSCSRKRVHGRWETKSGRIVWCLVVETKTCTSENSPTRPATCSAATPPTFSCGSTYN